MPTFQEIYNKHNDAIAQGLISPDEPLSTFAQRGFQVTGDPSYKNVADSGWLSNAIRSRSADLSNFIESGPVDEFTSDLIGRIGDLFGITPSSSRAVGKKLPRMAVDFIPMAVGAAFAVPTGGVSLLPALGMAGTSALSAASAFEDTGRPLDAIIGGAAPYVGGKLSEMGTRAALNFAAKSPALQRLGFTGGTKITSALTAQEAGALGADLPANVLARSTVTKTMLDKPLDKILGYVGGEVAANAGFTGLDLIQQGRDAVFNRDYLFANLVGNLPFAAVDMVQSAKTRQIGQSEINLPEAKPIYRTPGEERMHRALAMFKDLEDPRQIESLKRQYGLDIANIELNTEKLRTAQYLRTEKAQSEKQNFANKWNEFLDTDPLFNQATNGAFKITQGGAFGKELVNFDAVLNADNLPPKAQAIVDDYKQKVQNVKARYTSAVNSLADGTDLYSGLQRSVEELGLDQFVQTPIEQRDYHKVLKDSFLSPEGIDLVRDIQRKEANLEPLNPELFQEFMDFYSGKRTDLDFDRRADMAVAVSLARGAVPKLKEAKVKAKIAEKEGQKLQDVIEAGLKPVEEQAKKFVIDSTPYQELQAKIAQDEAERLRLEAEDELNKTKMEIQRSTDVAARQAAYERLKVQQIELAKRERDVAAAATVYLSAQKQQREFVARAEAAKKAGQVVEPVVQPVKDVQPKDEVAPEEFLNNVDEETPVVPWYEQDAEAQINALTATARIKKNEGEAQRLVEVELKKLNQQQKKDLADMLGVKPSEIAVSIVNDRGQMGYGAEARFEDSFTKGVRLASNGKGESFLIPVPNGDYQTVKPFAEALMKKVAPKEAQGRAEELIALEKFFNNPEVSYAEIKAQPEATQAEGKIYGAASYEAKKIFINSRAFDGLNPAQRAGFVFAHEHSHIAFEKAKAGVYGPEAQVSAELAEKWVMTADPQAKQVVQDVLMDLHLPKELRDSDGVRDVLQNLEPNEWLANAMGMYAVGMVKPNKPKMAFSLLPRPIREFFEWSVKSMQNLTKAAKLWFKLRGDKAQYRQAKNVQALMDSIRRSYRQAEWDATEAEAFLRIQPEDMIEKVSDLQFAKGDVSAMTGKPAFKEQPKKWFEGQFASWVSPLHTIARLNKEFVEPVFRVFNSDNAKTNAIMNVEKALWGEYSTGNKIKINAKDMERVNSSPPLRKTFNHLMSYATQMNRRLVQFDPVTSVASLDMNAITPQLRGEIAQFTPEAQQALTSYLIRMEMANRTAQKIIVSKEKEGFAARLSLILANRDSFKKSADFKKARTIADGVIEDLVNNRPDLAESKLTMLDDIDRGKTMETAQIMTAQFKQLQEYYDTHPTFMSLRRYKEFKRRIRKPGQADDVLDADTPGELDKLVKQYEAQGWKADDKVIRGSDRRFKEQYQMNDDLLEIIRQQENAMRAHIETLMLPDNVKASLYDQLNTVDMVTREINGKEVYRPMGARKFAGDLDRFDALEQFMRYIPAAMSAVHNRALGAEVSFWMQNPELNNLQMQKDQFMVLYEQSKTTDPEWARKLNKANAIWHIGWNLPGHIAELFQPMAAHVHELVAQGDSLPRALARLAKAEKEMINVQKERIKATARLDDAIKVDANGKTYEGLAAVWLKANGAAKDNVEIAELLTEKIHRVQRAPMSEVRQFVGEEHQKLEKLSLGEKQPTLGEMLSKPMHTYANAAMGFYSQFPMHNGVVALVSAYRQARAKGQTPTEAMNTAELFDLTVNNSGGRLERSEMYGKLGGAGHLVFSLSSYVRGRFAQLATYYKHGYNGDEFAGLTKGEQANARKAFKTMILAQLGAAGLMGLPFVGAGIALMEELLGEDIKGRMYEALDEVTEDPSLTRALTHGFATSFAESLGIPADLHSRFALSSFLGTNAYDGVSAKSFLGPSVAMLNSLWGLGGAMAQGKSLEESLTVGGPGGVKRLAEALSDDFQRDNPDASMAWSMLGFRSSEMTKRKEFKSIVDKREIESRREMEVAANRISEKMSQPGVARKMLLDEAIKMVPSGLTGQQKQMILKKNIQDLSNKVAMIEANKVAPEDPRMGISNRIAPEVSNTARSMGVTMPDPMERARAFAIQKTRSSLGQPVSDRPVKNAMMRDLQWETNPWSF